MTDLTAMKDKLTKVSELNKEFERLKMQTSAKENEIQEIMTDIMTNHLSFAKDEKFTITTLLQRAMDVLSR